MKACLLLALALAAGAACARAQEPTALLAKDGAALATIVLPDAATPVERSAAEELRAHLDAVTGGRFAVTNESACAEGARLLVGGTSALAKLLPSFDPQASPYDGIVLKTVGRDLLLAGHPRRGALYAAYTFLEDAVGVRWWTSSETYIPKRPTLPLPSLDLRYAPPLRFREAYYLDSFDARFKTRLKGNFSSRTRYMLAPLEMIPESYGGNHRLIFFTGRKSAYHSFYELLPPGVYFAAHPEWYSEIKGTRTHKEAQLCLTNEEMREELTKNALALLRADPGADIIQVSQNDSEGRCTCAKCLAAEQEEGGAGTASGPLLRFVNRVAEEVEKEFPNVFVETFAYQYTRKAPAQVRPRRNVLIRLCSIECSFSQPLGGDAKENRAFAADVEAWSRLAGSNLFGWDYVANFSSYMLPHPNLRVLAPNIRFYVKHGATGLFEQGDALCSAGDFARLRYWLISHLLWNPQADENALLDTFLRGYYGERAGRALRRYIDFTHDRAAASGVSLGCYQQNVTRWLDCAGACEAARLMSEALAAAADDEARDPVGNKGLRDRVLREKLSLDHAWLLNYDAWMPQVAPDSALFDGPRDPLSLWRRWEETCRKFGVKAYRETTTEETFAQYLKKQPERYRARP
jgi:hypothetical protein